MGMPNSCKANCGCSIWFLAGMVSLVFLLTTGTAILVGLEAAYAWMLDRVANGRAAVAALDLGGQRQPGMLVFRADAVGRFGRGDPRLRRSPPPHRRLSRADTASGSGPRPAGF